MTTATRTPKRDPDIVGRAAQARWQGKQQPIDVRFWGKVDCSGGPKACWRWLARTTRDGYGQFDLAHGVIVSAHRYAYETTIGPIPDGHEVDHVRARGCTHRDCVNPSHLEAVTDRVNVLRSDCPPAINARKTHCSKGHPLSGDNLVVTTKRQGRRCRICLIAHQHAAKMKRRLGKETSA